MSTRRLLATTSGMAVAAVVLLAVTPDLSWLASSGPDLQGAVDTAGADAVLLSGVAALAWATWAWGVLGLLLTALAALPGAAGALARAVARRLLPASARRAAALALGLGLAATPALAGCASAPAPAAVDLAGSSAAGPVHDPPVEGTVGDWPAEGPVADWPADVPGDGGSGPGPAAGSPVPPPAVPDWTPSAPGTHVVLRGDCLWDIAGGDLRLRTGREPTDGEIATAVRAWWLANASVIGPDPDLVLPGQVLHPPPA